MHAVIVIPARFGSQRFPGKPLAQLGGQSLIERTWRIASAVRGVSQVYVASDNAEIEAHARAFGASVVHTSPECRNGTERVYAALQENKVKPDLVINLQGDAVLTPPHVLEALINEFIRDPAVRIATPAVALGASERERLRTAKKSGDSSGTLVVFDRQNNALYFSKAFIPYERSERPGSAPVYRHIGLYAYRYAALEEYLRLPEGVLERAEGLEQLRLLEHGIPIRVVAVDYRGRTHCSVDTPEDLKVAEQLLETEGEVLGG